MAKGANMRGLQQRGPVSRPSPNVNRTGGRVVAPETPRFGPKGKDGGLGNGAQKDYGNPQGVSPMGKVGGLAGKGNTNQNQGSGGAKAVPTPAGGTVKGMNHSWPVKTGQKSAPQNFGQSGNHDSRHNAAARAATKHMQSGGKPDMDGDYD